MTDSDNQDLESCRIEVCQQRRRLSRYGLAIPDTMLTDEIKNSEHYQTFLAFSTGLIPPKKSNGKSISKSEAKEQEEARHVHETHECLVSEKPKSVEESDESDGKPANRSTGRRRPSDVVFKDTSNVSKKKSLDVSQKLKGSSEGAGITPKVPDDSTSIFITSSEGADKSDWSNDAKVNEGEIKWLSSDEEEKIHDDDDERSIDIEETDEDERTESDNDEYVVVDASKEMKDGEDAKTGKDDEEMTDAKKADAEKTEEENGDHEKVRIILAKVDQAKDVNAQDNQATTLAYVTHKEMPKIPPTSSSLSVSSGFGSQFLNLSSDTFLVGTTKESADTEINSLLDIQIQQEVPHIQSPTLLNVLVLVIPEQTILSMAHTHAPIISTIPSMLQQTTPIPTPPILSEAPTTKVDHSKAIEALVQANLINKVKNQLPQLLPKAVSDLVNSRIEKLVCNMVLKNPIFIAPSSSTPPQPSSKPAKSLSELELMQIIFEKIDKSRSYMSHDKHQELYDALLNSIMLDEASAKGDVNLVKVLRKRDGDDDQDPSARSDQGKKKKKRKGKYAEESKKSSASKISSKDTKETSFDNVVTNVDDQPDVEAAPKTYNATKNDWFKQSPRTPTSDPEWNKDKKLKDRPEQTWFNDLVYAEKDPLTFYEPMATPTDFSKFAMDRLKLDKITKADLVGPVYKLLKGTCQSSIKLEYNIEEGYKALFDQLDSTNPEGDRCTYELSKPLPLKGFPCHLTIPSEHFFNNILEYLKSKNLERTVGYNKDAAFGISHWGPKRRQFNRSQINRLFKHDVYSTLKILSMVSVTVDKKFSYGYLEEIVVRRADRPLYKFKEGDFINLHLNDIEDMLLLVV
ncbi:hypothetical protein Tco_0852854 [Tanacetum coccineum]